MLSFFNSNKNLFTFLFFFIFLIIGIAIFPHYGISIDEDNTRLNGFVSLKYIFESLGLNNQMQTDTIVGIPTMSEWKEQGHGVVFDLPTAFIEFLFNIDDSRDYFLMRHLVTFIFFFIGVCFFYLLIKNRYNSSLFAIMGTSFLILSPRIFANSFFNNKDIIFMSLFIVSLFFAANFLVKPNLKTAISFSLISALAIDTRILGIIIPALVLTIYIIDIFNNNRFIKSKLRPLVLVLVALPFFIIIFWPYLWENPLNNFFQAFKILSKHDVYVFNLYQGDYINAKNVPWHYPLIWIFITTPLMYIIFFILGFFILFVKLISRIIKIEENDIWKGKHELVDLLFFATFFAPLLIIIILNSTLYDGWRHLYFLYPSFLLISLTGFNYIKINYFKKKTNLLFVLIFLLITPTLIWMIKNHPYQNIYFNKLAGKNFYKSYDMDYWGLSNYAALNYIVKNDSKKTKVAHIGTTDLFISQIFLEKKYRNQISLIDNIKDADYIINNYRNWLGKKNDINLSESSDYTKFYEIKIDDIPINTTFKKNDK